MVVSKGLAASWDLVYEANVLPHDEKLGDKAWKWCAAPDNKLYDWTGSRNPKLQEINPEGELHVNDNDPKKTAWWARWLKKGEAEESTMEARVKSLSNRNGLAVQLRIAYQENFVALLIYPDHIQFWQDGGRQIKADMKQYHILRLTVDNKKVTAYLDGQKVLDDVPKILENPCKGWNWFFALCLAQAPTTELVNSIARYVWP